eukprot:m.20051 g.20051  ORF g.20051 m.20051 type:complete len:227 (+) comp10109_c0_seq1:29-709(+)
MVSTSILVTLVAVGVCSVAGAPTSALGVDPVSPDTWEAVFNTDLTDSVTGAPADPFLIEVTRSLSPLGADRFYALVKAGFYNNSAFFRVVPAFVIQFGISGSADQNQKWLHNSIKDDPVITAGSNTAGTITFADAGPETRSTQVFFNLGDNSRLDAMGFTVFGKVKTCCDELNTIFNPTPGVSGGVDQGLYEQKGNTWIKQQYPGINFITTTYVAPTSTTASAALE